VKFFNKSPLSVVWSLTLLLICMNPVFIEVAFLTLTMPNEIGVQFLFNEVEKFLLKLSQFTKCHIKAVRGFERRNTHEHIILLVPTSEEDRFNNRHLRFQPGIAWRWTWHMELFDHTRKAHAYSYTISKHIPVLPDVSPELYCPRHYHQCRQGTCKISPR